MELYDIIVFFGICTSLLMMLSLIVRPLKFRNVMFSLLLLWLGYLQLFIYMIVSQKIFDYPHIFFTQIPVLLCLGPLIYFYVHIILQNKQHMERHDWLHFIPVVMSVVILIPFFMHDAGTKRELIYGALNMGKFAPLRLTIVVIITTLALYLLVSIKAVWSLHIKRNPAQQKLIVLLITLFCSVLLAILASIGIMTLWFPLIKFNSMFLSLFIVVLYILTQRYPYMIPFGTVPAGKKASNDIQSMSKEEVVNLASQLKLIMDEEKFYIDEELSLLKLSEAMEVTPHFLSRFLNEHYKKNFNSFVNAYRIREARKLLLEEPQRNTLSIAYACGFNSYTAFYTSFKKATNLSPAEFRSKHIK